MSGQQEGAVDQSVGEINEIPNHGIDTLQFKITQYPPSEAKLIPSGTPVKDVVKESTVPARGPEIQTRRILKPNVSATAK